MRNSELKQERSSKMHGYPLPAPPLHQKMLGKRKGHISSIAPSKRKRSVSAIEEITFDFGAREDYLSGFHKRKVQRIKQAREEAVKKEREERVIARKLVSRLLG